MSSNVQRRLTLTIIGISGIIMLGILIWYQTEYSLIKDQLKQSVDARNMPGGSGTNETHTMQEHIELLDKNPNDLHALEAVSRSYFVNKDWDNALQYFDRLVMVNPTNPEFLYLLAFVQAKKEDFHSAEANFLQFVEMTNEHVGHMSLGILYGTHLNRAEDAIKHYEMVINSKEADNIAKDRAQKEIERLKSAK
ncbi:MAG: tetratricopeptide repeat protein [Desulfovibrionaceae bacterium]